MVGIGHVQGGTRAVGGCPEAAATGRMDSGILWVWDGLRHERPAKATQSHIGAKEEGRMQNDEGSGEATRSHPRAIYKPPSSQGIGKCSLVFLLCSSCAALVLLLCCSCASVAFPWGLWRRGLGSTEPVPCFDSTRSLFIQMNAHFLAVAFPAAVPPVADVLPVSNRQP